MTLKQIADIVDNNDPLIAAEYIAKAIEDLSEKETKAVLFFTLIKAERKGRKAIAEIFAAKADTVLTNIDTLNQLSAL